MPRALFTFPTSLARPSVGRPDEKDVVADHVGGRPILRVDLEAAHDEVDGVANRRLLLTLRAGGARVGFGLERGIRSRLGRDPLDRLVGRPERAFACVE